MTRDQAREEIRARISCLDYLEKSKGGQYCCPYCGSGTGPHGTGAVKHYPEGNTWHCFACDRSGDVIDLFRQVTGADYNTALHQMAGQIGIVIDGGSGRDISPIRPASTGGSISAPPDDKGPQRAAERATEAPADYTEYYRACALRIADPAPAAYLEGRGISVQTAADYLLGYDPAADPANAPGAMGSEGKMFPCPRIIIPSGPGYYVGRRIDGKTDHKCMNSKGSSAEMFNADVLYRHEVQEVFVTEGAIDALSVIEAGADAVGLHSAGNYNLLIKQLERRRPSPEPSLILCFDNDSNPDTRAKIEEDRRKCAEGLRQLNIPFAIADLCGAYKDPNEYLQRDREGFIEAVTQTKSKARAEILAQRERARQAEIDRQESIGPGMVDAFLSAIKTRRYEPIPTGITDIDNALGGGFMRQWLILLGAPPGAGKTALAQWIFEGMAKRGTYVLYLNLEMSREQMLARSLARIAAQGGEKIKPVEILQGYKWDWTQEAIVTGAAEKYRQEIAPHMVYNPDGVGANLDSIMEYCEAAADRAQAADLPVPILVIDYLQVITGGTREDKVDLIQRTISRLKGYAIKYNTVVFAIMAQNRESNRTGTSGMQSGRDTSNIEYGADLLLGLDYTKCLKRDGVPGKSMEDLTAEDMKFKTLRIHKGRFSTPGTQVDLFFDGGTMTYNQIAKRDSEPPRKAMRI